MRRWALPVVVVVVVVVAALVVVVGVLVGGGGDGDTAGPTPADAGGPITVGQLLARPANSPVTVQGLVHVERGVARLCDAIVESYPPQCGAPSVEVVGLDLDTVEGATTAQGVTWKEGAVLVLQRAEDGRFTVVDSGAGQPVRVVLGVYSGVPDPTWTLTAGEAAELTATLARLPRVDTSAPVGGLGYHGFTLDTPDGTLVVYAGTVASTGSDPPYVLDDPDRRVERLLVDTARSHVTPEELAVVEAALDQP